MSDQDFTTFTIVFRGDIRKLPFNPLSHKSDWGEPIACSTGDLTADSKPDDDDLATIAYFSGAADARDTIKALRAQIAKIEAAAEPFATVGRMIGGPFGPALFPDDEMAFRRGCTWSEDGEKHILTWGDFRDLCDVLKNGEHNV